jgi:hypothetical protein
MTVEPELTKGADDAPRESRKLSFLRGKLAYIVVLALAVAGVAYTNVSQRPLIGYWEFLTLATGVLCVVSEWENAGDRDARLRLMWTQVLHWAAILVTMNILLLSAVQNLLPAPAMSLVLLTLLALGTFLAGVNFLSLQICFLGLAMALAVPAIAWLKQSALLFALAAVFLIGLGVAFWPRQTGARVAK